MTRVNGHGPQKPPQEQQVMLPGQPAPLQTQVVPQPVPTPEGDRVVLMAQSMNGVFSFFLSAEHADVLAGELQAVAKQITTGLLTPPASGLFVPGSGA